MLCLRNTRASNNQQVKRRLYCASSPTLSTSSARSWDEPVELQDSGDEYEPSGGSSREESEEDTDRNIGNLVHDTSHDNEPDANSAEDAAESRGKKRKVQMNTWKKVKAKRLRNSGKSYTSVFSTEREIGPKCSGKCKLACTKFTDENRKEIFDKYWQLGSLDLQRNFLASCIRQLSVKYRRVSATVTTPRAPNHAFYLKLNGEEVRVCRTFLVNTLGISQRQVTTVMSKISPSGFVGKECRGKHGNQKKFSEELVQSVYNHINSIPRIESHYIRADSECEYIDDNLTLVAMHRDYEAKRKAAGKEAVPYSKYASIFNYEFNIGFFVPKKDVCDECTAYHLADEDGKKELQAAYDEHLKQKVTARMEKDKDKERISRGEENLYLAVYDFQAAMVCPTGPYSAIFYKSRLSCYNFTVTEYSKEADEAVKKNRKRKKCNK